MSKRRQGLEHRRVMHTTPTEEGYEAMLVGWDWASAAHDVTVMDDEGRIVDRWALEHSEAGIEGAIRRLASYGQPESLPVAIETASGLVVDRLMVAGHPVVPIHPNGFNAARPRWGASKAKSDPGDSWKLADYLRTDGHRLRQLREPDTVTRHLQSLCRTRDDHLNAKTAATNQLAALLDTHWPGAKALFARLDSDIALNFLERYPTPAAAAHLGPGRMAAFLKRHAYSGRRSATELIERLRHAPTVTSGLDPQVLTECVQAQVRLLRTLLATIVDLDRALKAAAAAHPKASVLAPMPRIGQINLAQILAEVGPILDRAVDVQHACAEIGASPVTKESGKTKAVHFRWAANTRARDAFATFADNSRHSSPWAAELYRAARKRGKRHPQAVRVLMPAWMRVAWTCWHTHTRYDVNHHGAEQRLAKQNTA